MESGKGELCRKILSSLPDWFGIPEAIELYVREVETLPVIAAEVGDQLVGIVSFKQHTPFAAEIHVMGVLPDFHRRGVGRALVAEAEAMARSEDLAFLTVKTLSPARENSAYEMTRAFYQGVGFVPIEEFPKLWGPATPALQLIKCLRCG